MKRKFGCRLTEIVSKFDTWFVRLAKDILCPKKYPGYEIKVIKILKGKDWDIKTTQ